MLKRECLAYFGDKTQWLWGCLRRFVKLLLSGSFSWSFWLEILAGRALGVIQRWRHIKIFFLAVFTFPKVLLKAFKSEVVKNTSLLRLKVFFIFYLKALKNQKLSKTSKLSKTFKSPSQPAYSKQVSSWPSNRELFSHSPSTSRPQGIHAVVFNLLKGIIFLANLIAVYPISLFLFRRRDEQCGHSLEGICLSGDYEK